jgi:hypothetical protein
MSNTNTSEARGSYRTNYRDEDCMKFTAKDQAVLDARAAERSGNFRNDDLSASSKETN